ncbi:hypothetical protein [Hydrogenimonas cancrithermarum]|uniref:Uncharacterized protein n=1 Tax=Hydrogenimonas cancrithermarum TaxID=2993563 RepID=A0ABM8FK49_9BACT|nr:hypothetical protein [Hydrogenimonas cancrithermarum]BDY12028.1 hypothetical protein HCR_03400 [Hydrogenimonas cancrithermarum]
MMHELNARVVKIIGTKYPRLRTMIRNHPYTKIVGMGVVKCLLDDMHMTSDEVSDELLTEMIERGIELYHEKEDEIKEIPVLEHKRHVLCDYLQRVATEYLELSAG